MFIYLFTGPFLGLNIVLINVSHACCTILNSLPQILYLIPREGRPPKLATL